MTSEDQRWRTVQKPIQPIHLHKQPFAGHTHVVLVRLNATTLPFNKLQFQMTKIFRECVDQKDIV